MATTRIIQLADGEEMICHESTERARPIVDDPRRGALERRIAAEIALARTELRVLPD